VYTSIFLMMVAQLASAAGAVHELEWAEDYYCAHEECSSEHKPMVAFIGQGEQGRKKLGLSDKSRQLIKEHYVCVYIDANGEDNKLARTLNIKRGVVISTRGGRNVAFRYDGKLVKQELESQLERFCGEAVAGQPVRRNC
jgi:hypothetical protein